MPKLHKTSVDGDLDHFETLLELIVLLNQFIRAFEIIVVDEMMMRPFIYLH